MRKRQTFADIFALCSNLLAYVYEKRIVRWREAVNLFSRKNAKELLIASFISIQDEQPREISYYMSQQLSKDTSDIETACKKMESVNKQQIIEAAENIMINTIFFLRN